MKPTLLYSPRRAPLLDRHRAAPEDLMKYEASTTIHASPAAVWAVLLDTESYPEWDPYCDRIEGSVELGKKIRAYSKLSPGRAFPVKVVELAPNQRMTWRGGMPLGLFKGERTFTLEPGDDGSTRFTVREEFGGPMLGLIRKSIPDMTEAFEAFARGLKARSEEQG